MNPSSHDRIAHLTEELRRVRRDLRSAKLLTAVPLFLLGTWVLSAGAPPSQDNQDQRLPAGASQSLDELERRVSELEARLLKGPGNTTRIQAPFEVVGPGGNVILQVSQAFPTVSNGVGIFWQGKDGGVTVSRSGHDIAGMGTSEDGEGGLLFIGDKYGIPRAEVRGADGVSVMNGGGKVVAAMLAGEEGSDNGRFAIMHGDNLVGALEGNEEGAMFTISNDEGKAVAQIGVDEGNGYIATLDPNRRYAEVEMGVSDKGDPGLTVSQKGKARASLRLNANAGHLSVSNSKDLVVANVSGTGPGEGGAVTVGNGSGKGVANMTAGADGSGLVQVFQPGAGSVAVLTQDKLGGLLQIKNGSGTPVASLKASSEGAGYWQLTDPSGNPMVEGGSDEGRGIVRAGPFYTCIPAMGTAVVGVASLPDCIRGRKGK